MNKKYSLFALLLVGVLFATPSFAVQSQDPDSFRFVFDNPVPVQQGPFTLILDARGIGNQPDVPGSSLKLTHRQDFHSPWVGVQVPEWGQSVAGITVHDGASYRMTIGQPGEVLVGEYRLEVTWPQSDGDHTLLKPWTPNKIIPPGGINDDFDLLSFLTAGPAEELISPEPEEEVPYQGTMLLSGTAPAVGDDVEYIVYQRQASGVKLQVLHAEVGKYSVELGGMTCDHEVTIDFKSFGDPSGEGIDATATIFVGVKWRGVQVDQPMIMPFSRGFEPQCQP